MRHYLDIPDLPIRAFKKRGFGQNLATLEGKGGDAPSAPDPTVVGSAETKTNEDTASYNKALNQNNYTNPFGSQQSQVVGTDPKTGAPIYQTNITANPKLQTAMDSLLGNIGTSNTADTSALNGLFGVSNNLNSRDASGMTQAQNAYYDQATSYLDPQFAQQDEALKSSLANQGITPGSEAYNNAMGNQSRQKTFAYNQAQDSAITQGTQLGLNTANTQAGLFGQIGSTAQLPYSNLQTIAQLIPGYSGPATTAANPANIGSAINNQYQGQLAGYNADVSSSNQTESTVGTIAAAALAAY